MLLAARKLPALPRTNGIDPQIRLVFGPKNSSLRRYIHTTPVRRQNYYNDESTSSAAGTFAKILGISAVVVGAPIGYAVYDPKFRTTLESYLPFTKPVLERISPSSPSISIPSTERQKPSIASPSLPSYTRPVKVSTEKLIGDPKQQLEVKKETPAQKDAEDIDSRPDKVVAATGAAPVGVAVENSPTKGSKEATISGHVSVKNEPTQPPSIAPSTTVETKVKADRSTLTDDTNLPPLESKAASLQKQDWKVGEEPASRTSFESFLNLLDGRKLTPAEEMMVEAVVNSTTERLEREFEDYVLEMEEEHEWDLQLQLKRQIAAHADSVLDALKRQEVELEKHFQSRLDRRVEEEKTRYNLQVAGALGQILGIHQALTDRSQAERAGRKAQYLWHISHAIFDSVKYGSPTGAAVEDRMTPLGKYVSLAKLFCDSHPFVLSILRAVPEEALVRGVHTEDFLRHRFNQVHSVARRVALIQDDNSGLFRYFLSYLQSIFVSDHHYDLAKQLTIDVSELTTFRILSTAAKCVQRGDFESAVRFVGQLKGEPQKVAQEWLHEARLYLETKQIARLLLAHSTSVGLSTVPLEGKK